MSERDDTYSAKAGACLVLPLWFSAGYHDAFRSIAARGVLAPDDEYRALLFTAAWTMGYRAYTIPTLGLPDGTLLDVLRCGGDDDHRGIAAIPSPSSVYETLRRIGEESGRLLPSLPSTTDAKRIAADIHTIPKFCEGLSKMYTPHKASPCPCRAVEVIAEIGKEGIARPLAINPVKVVREEDGLLAPKERKRIDVTERLGGILSFVEGRYGEALLELDSEYTKSKESRRLLISREWEFTTRIRKDSLIGRKVVARMESRRLDVCGSWYETDDYGGRFQVVGRRVFPKGRETSGEIILYLSTRRLSARKVIEERSHRWRIENFFKNVDIDSTPGNTDSEIRGYYTLAFFMAELSMAFKASTKTVGLILNREGSVAVSGGVMKIKLRNIDGRLLKKIRAYVDYINAKSKRKRVSLTYKPMGR